METINIQENQPIKPGYKTTEFWATIIGSVIVGASSQYNIQLDQSTIVSLTSLIITYTISRTAHKIISDKGAKK